MEKAPHPLNMPPEETGDRPALEHETKAVIGYLAKRLKRVEDAHDLAQEVFLRLLEKKTTEGVREPQRYIFGIAAHVLADFKRCMQAEGRRVTVDSELADSLASAPSNWLPDETSERLNLQQQLQRGLAQLPPHQRAILILHKRDGLSLKEIATKLGLSVFTVKIYLTRAKAHFRTLSWDR